MEASRLVWSLILFCPVEQPWWFLLLHTTLIWDAAPTAKPCKGSDRQEDNCQHPLKREREQKLPSMRWSRIPHTPRLGKGLFKVSYALRERLRMGFMTMVCAGTGNSVPHREIILTIPSVVKNVLPPPPCPPHPLSCFCTTAGALTHSRVA